jgi:hypothetical protein
VEAIPVSAYLVLCFLVGFRGMRTRVGYWGIVFLSIFLTPFLIFIALYLLDTEPKYSFEAAPEHRLR